MSQDNEAENILEEADASLEGNADANPDFEAETSLNYDMLSRQMNGRITPLILGGPPGAGKTHAAMSLRNNDQEPFARIAAAGKTKEDFTTYPVPKEMENGDFIIKQPITETSIVPLLAKNIKKGFGVLLIDDVTAADPSVQSALLEIAQFGRIGEHQLGENVAIVMTGNGISDGAYAAQWSSALINRSHYVEFRADLKIWRNLPENQNCDPIIYGFLEANKDAFAPEVTKQSEKDKYFDNKGRAPSARQWTTLGNALQAQHGGYANFKKSILFKSVSQYCESLIGEKTASKLTTFANMMLTYPTSKQLMADPTMWDRVSEVDKSKPGAVYAVAHSLRQHAASINNEINEKYGNKANTSKAAEKEKSELLLSFSKVVARLMDGAREQGAFCMRYLIASAPADDVLKGLLADLVYEIDDADPVLANAGFGDILKNIKEMGETLTKR
jgi:hypothetical protein